MFPRRYDRDEDEVEVVDQGEGSDNEAVTREMAIQARVALIKTRPQFQIRQTIILRERCCHRPRIIQMYFRNGDVMEGVEEDILENVEDRIRAAAEASLAEEQQPRPGPLQPRIVARLGRRVRGQGKAPRR